MRHATRAPRTETGPLRQAARCRLLRQQPRHDILARLRPQPLAACVATQVCLTRLCTRSAHGKLGLCYSGSYTAKGSCDDATVNALGPMRHHIKRQKILPAADFEPRSRIQKGEVESRAILRSRNRRGEVESRAGMSDSPLQRGPGGLQQRITRAAVEGICHSNVSIHKGTSRHTLPNTAGHSRLTALGHNRCYSHNVFQSGSSNYLRPVERDS